MNESASFVCVGGDIVSVLTPIGGSFANEVELRPGRGFMSYTSGVYTHACDSWANHAITVIGWGPDYWHCLNSWGDWWGDQGRFKVGLCVSWTSGLGGWEPPNRPGGEGPSRGNGSRCRGTFRSCDVRSVQSLPFVATGSNLLAMASSYTVASCLFCGWGFWGFFL